jgi:lipoyl synthase
VSNMIEKPAWFKKKLPKMDLVEDTIGTIREKSINTVCDGADCPNRNECYANKIVTFMILGNTCTRNCSFCAVATGCGEAIDQDEPLHVGQACRDLGLRHVVVTSVTRDDIADGGASHFARTVSEIRKLNPGTVVELLIPDFQGDYDALKHVVDSNPEILNHNIETVPSLYKRVRPQAEYTRSIELLRRAKEMNPDILTKAGLMLGLGETESELMEVFDDLREVGCDIFTLGQYLPPTSKHYPLVEYIHPDVFKKYEDMAYDKGFRYVASGPLVRSSYMAGEAIEHIRNTIDKHR